ncbi:MAG: PhnD/SsuA/transferrin family substrate-binding protein [Myxococcales bacterium]|nr:PhnD/SsuA/transferrin family substrate-binding protein [Myxococcales bacterium]
MKPIILGCVLYDPKVSIIWDIIRDYFEANAVPIDVVFYTNYELQVSAHLAGHVDIAWNSPLAWVDSQLQSGGSCRAIAMRDTDRDRRSHLVVERGGSVATIGDLAGRVVGFGAKDSPQATLIPREHLLLAGLALDAYETRVFDKLVGKHGDHIGGELDAFRALEQGEVDASWMLDLNWESWTRDGTVDPARYHVLDKTALFDHCVFTVRGDFPLERQQTFLDVLFTMDYANPDHREMMDLEGLKAWQSGRTSGFGLLRAACEHQRFFQDRG